MNKHCVQELSKYIDLQNINDIIELTYAYQKIWPRKYFNQTLFEWFGWITLEKRKNEQYDYYTVHSHISRRLESIKDGLTDFQKSNHYTTINEDYSKMIDKSIFYMQWLITLAILWTPFEIEKTWMTIPLSQEERAQRIFQLNELEDKLFGWEIKHNQDEIYNSYVLMAKNFETNSFMLTHWEKKRFKLYISKVKNLKNFNLTDKQIKQKIVSSTVKSILDEHPSIFWLRIARKDYLSIFELCFKIYNIDKKIIFDERSSIYDWANALHIPKDSRYAQLSLKTVITLIAHEIETHYLIEKNNKKLFAWVRWWRNLPKDEGLAIVHEWFVHENDINRFSASRSLALTLMWEILDWPEYFKFLRLYYKLLWTEYKKSSIMRFLRQKRNYPYKSHGWQHKDVTYTRWAQKVIEYLQQWKNYSDLYISKVDFQDIDSVKRIVSDENITISKNKFIAERLKSRLLWLSSNQQEFKQYLIDKYNFLSAEEIEKIHLLKPKQELYIKEIKKIIKRYL